MTPVEERIDHERDYLERTIATVRQHRDAEICWPSWANIFADEIERLWKVEEALLTEHSAHEEARELLRRLVAQGYVLKLPGDLSAGVQRVINRTALPAMESAQPPQNYQVDSIDMGGDPQDVPEGDPPFGYVGPTGSGASE